MLSKNINKLIAFALSALIFTPVLPAIDVQAITRDTEKKQTGLKESTKEEREELFKDAIRPTNVNLNKIGAERVYGNNFKGLSTINDAVEIGEEFELDSSNAKSLQNNYTLPSTVDNSDSKYFPEIGDQGGLNSCASWATTYYNMTYMTALKNDYAVKDTNGKNIPSKVFSPRWTYSLVNDGENVGENANENFEVLKSHGATTIDKVPYITNGNDSDAYRKWPSDKNIWKDATQYTIKDYGLIDANPNNEPTYVTSNIDSDLDQVKTMVTNGYLLNFYTYAYTESEMKIKDNPNSSNDNSHINEYAIAAVSNSGAHEVTIVGYNDDIWVDINNNNKVDNGELGAFKIANTWGKESYNNGFYWLAYDSLNVVSSVENVVNSTTRRASINGGLVEFLVPETPKEPSALLEVTLDHSARNEILLEIGVYDRGRLKTVFYPIFNRNGGAYSFSGKTQNEEATFYINLDYITKAIGFNIVDGTEIGVIVSDTAKNNKPLTIKNVNLVNFNEGIIDSANIANPIVIDGLFSEFSLKYSNEVVLPSLKPATISTKDKISTTGNFEINLQLPQNNPRATKVTLSQNNNVIYTDNITSTTSLNKAIAVNGLTDGLYNYVATIFDAEGNKLESNQITVEVNTTIISDTFDPAKVYNTGDIVMYKGIKYKAKYWTQGGTPDTNPSWEIIIETNPDGSKPYLPGVAYNTGDLVSYEGKVYKANWWTNTVPGSDSSWTFIK
ncbi:MAG: carbohydrate-binding protein [Clostridium sp.]